MLEGLKEAMQYLIGVGNEAEKVQVLEICGETYANKRLERYGAPNRAAAIEASSLSALVDYIKSLSNEFSTSRMIIQIEDPEEVNLISELNIERKRECLFSCKAEISKFRFDNWYDQERFMIEIQSNFVPSSDRDVLIKFAGNVEQKNSATFSDSGRYDERWSCVKVGCDRTESGSPGTVPHLPGNRTAFLELCVSDGGQTDSGLLPDRSGGRRLEERSSEPH